MAIFGFDVSPCIELKHVEKTLKLACCPSDSKVCFWFDLKFNTAHCDSNKLIGLIHNRIAMYNSSKANKLNHKSLTDHSAIMRTITIQFEQDWYESYCKDVRGFEFYIIPLIVQIKKYLIGLEFQGDLCLGACCNIIKQEPYLHLFNTYVTNNRVYDKYESIVRAYDVELYEFVKNRTLSNLRFYV